MTRYPYKILSYHREMGRSYVIMECESCGARTKAFLWSWAGNGFRRCSGCKQELPYYLAAWGGSKR